MVIVKQLFLLSLTLTTTRMLHFLLKQYPALTPIDVQDHDPIHYTKVQDMLTDPVGVQLQEYFHGLHVNMLHHLKHLLIKINLFLPPVQQIHQELCHAL